MQIVGEVVQTLDIQCYETRKNEEELNISNRFLEICL